MTTITTEITFTVKTTTSTDGDGHVVQQYVLPDVIQQVVPEIRRGVQSAFRPSPPPQFRHLRRDSLIPSTFPPASRKSSRHSANISAPRSPPETPPTRQSAVPSFVIIPPTPQTHQSTAKSTAVEPAQNHLHQHIASKASTCVCSGISSVLQTHHSVFKASSSSARQTTSSSTRARDKLRHLLLGQFYELSTDCYEELLRRRVDPGRPGLDVACANGRITDRKAPKMQARHKLSGVSEERFRGLLRDMVYDLERRFPAFVE